MEEILSNILESKKTKTLREYEEIVQKSGMIWKKSFEYNTPITGQVNFDDFFKIAGKNVQKVCKFIVKCIDRGDSIEYVRSVQFFYKTVSGEIVEGFQQMHPQAPSKGKFAEKIFELEDDEYIIKMIGRTGLFLDAFGFETTKGRQYVFGGNGGGERELKAPDGLHFSNFGSIHCDGGVFSVLCDSLIIPNKEEDKNKQPVDFEQLGTAVKYIIDCLGIKDIFTLFKLNRYFASWRYSAIFLNKLSKRIIYSCNIQTRQYIEEIMKNANTSYRSIQQIQKLLNVTKNQISNPFGDQDFNGFTVTKNGGNGVIVIHSNMQNYRNSAFQTSFAYGELMFEAKLSDLFDEEFMQMLISRNACIVAGCYMKQPGFGAEGYVELFIRDDNAQKNIFHQKLSDTKLTKDWKQLFIKYEKDELSNEMAKFTPTSIKLLVGGKDTCYWGGHYGNIFSGITLRGIPFYSRKDKAFLSI
ncbi:hypothetical protein TTHERM_00997650 (macronuclear) [Tetrahymena thermophila SB210]|uniref:FBA domain-containing protein n=1 Tax=Tetrahymena thermophila (strain SB210) TaxID=312017 RepID=Q23QZ6_TETTS|nr:hypothetical protein TTHERM_00997650 [Tetrahymena thermophila SB210]EAR98960.2 hypothetical protein TTHERM_00997650 [Tetrahymena thermophila SB210]|eukprot:XP_001019205.2 hypothetical protein TTHERM_00997650 [Tetrahymena thermophila SB210]